jgi:predicted TIM-barrel fold metal-dependent hydrolase
MAFMSELPLIISVDDHVVEPPSTWHDRLPSRYRDKGPRVVQDTCSSSSQGLAAVRYLPGGNGPLTDWWVYEDLWWPVPQTMASAGVIDITDLTDGPIAYADMRPGCYDQSARLADMDLNHTEASLCFPSFPRFCGQTFLEAKDKDLALLCVEAYNDWMIDEWCGGSGGRLIPLCLVPLWDPILAAAEVRRNAGRGARAVAFTELPANLGLPSIHSADRHWDPLFEACDETETVICMHIGSGSKMPTTSPDAPLGVRVALTSSNAELSLTDWLMSGVLARFPRIKIAYSEGQVGWMPFLLQRMDQVFKRSRAWTNLNPALTEPPSTYVAGRVYGCIFDDEFGLMSHERIGIGQITFEVDYPHQDTTWPHTIDAIERMTTLLTPDQLERVVRTNALEMLGMVEIGSSVTSKEGAK